MTSKLELGSRIPGGDQAELFEVGKDVCKLYGSHIPARDAKRMAVREARALKMVAGFDDVSAPRVFGVRQFEGRCGVHMTRLGGQNLKCLLGDGRDPRPYMEEIASLHTAIHRHRTLRLPTLRGWLEGAIREAGRKLGTAFPIQDVLDRLAELPDSNQICHGDFHPANVMAELANPSAIDWPSALRGHPAADVCQSWLLMQRTDPSLADAYVEAYATRAV